MNKIIKFLTTTVVFLFFFNSTSYSNDIRTLGVGINVNKIDITGYKNLSCTEDNTKLSTWNEFKKCKKNNQNLYLISFEYDDRYAITEEYEGTQVAGHPVLMNIGVNENNNIEEINVITDPSAPWYFRKQSYLLWLRIYSKYGSSGWNCLENLPKKDHLLAGNKYINKICEKTFEKKKIVLHSEFYFINNKKDKGNLVSRTKMKIEKYPSS